MVFKAEEPKKSSRAERVAKFCIVAVSFLIVIKVIGSIYTGSIGIRADAFHSIVDLFGVIIGYFSIRAASRPADREHPFGHGKSEYIAGLIIAALIFVAAGLITYEAIKRFLLGGTLEFINTGIFITAAAIIINAIVAFWALKVSRSTESVALEATGRHLLADVLSSVAVLVGLILVRFTGLVILDPVVALLVVILIAQGGYIVIKKSFDGLMDRKLPETEEAVIASAIMECNNRVVSFHRLRTRKAGSIRYIDLHLVVPKKYSLVEAHEICDQLEDKIMRSLRNVSLIIHAEPCNEKCDQCVIPSDKCRFMGPT